MENVKVRQARLEDIEGILNLEEEVWPEGLRATKSQFLSRIKTFPEGNFVAHINGTIVGVVATEIVNYDLENPTLSWNEITDNGSIKRTHNPNGDTLYGVDLSVSPFGGNASKLLMEQIGKLAIRRNLKRGILGARIPRYHKFAGKMTAKDYVNARRNNRPIDPELIFYTRLSLKIVGLIPNYIEDPESCNYGVLLVWDNPFYGKPFSWLWSRFFRAK
jgi:ribosomal protein S18 acetylase RimI-like enzyme